MAPWTAPLEALGALTGDDGDLARLGISLFLGVFLTCLAWTLSSDRRSAPPF